MNAVYPLRVYYDKSCPMCREEIHALKTADHTARLELVDCSTEDFVDAYARDANISQDELLAAMHLRDANGHWYKAVDAFVEMYAAVGLTNIARMWAHPRWRPLWDRMYPKVVRNRQKLSRLKLHKPMRWLIRRAARRAEASACDCRT